MTTCFGLLLQWGHHQFKHRQPREEFTKLHISVVISRSQWLLLITTAICNFLISDFRRDLNIVYFLLGISPASNCSWPTFRNPVSVPSSKAGCTGTPSLWRWNWYRVPKRRPTTIWRRGNTQKKIYKNVIVYVAITWIRNKHFRVYLRLILGCHT